MMRCGTVLRIRTTDIETLQIACESLAEQLAECWFPDDEWSSDNHVKVILEGEGIDAD